LNLRQPMILPARHNKTRTYLLLATSIYAVVFVAVLVAHPGGPLFNFLFNFFEHRAPSEDDLGNIGKVYKNFENVYQIIPPVFAACCALYHAIFGRHAFANRRIGWFLIGAGCFSWSIGQCLWTYYETLRGVEVPFPGPPDIGYFGGYPFLIAGVALLSDKMPLTGRVRLLLDSALAASSVGVISWYFLVDKLWSTAGADRLTRLLTAAYPLADIIILFCALVLISGSWQNKERQRALACLAGGMILLACADSLFSYYNLTEQYNTGSWFDWCFSFGWILVGYAPLIRQWQPASADAEIIQAGAKQEIIESRPFWQSVTIGLLVRLMAPYVAAFGALSLLTYADYITPKPQNFHYISNTVLMLGLWLITLVILRQVFTLLENQNLTQQLKAFNITLEHKVAQRTDQLNSLLQLAKAVNNTREFDTVVNAAGNHTLHIMQADAVILWSSGGDVPEASLPARVFPNSVRQEYPGLIKFLTAHELVTDTVTVPLQAIAASYPSLKSKVTRGVVAPQISTGTTQDISTEKPLESLTGQCLIAPLFWQGKAIGMIAAVMWREPFEEDETAMLESIGVEVGTAMENARLYGAALKAADRDSVTGLLNHRAVHQRLDEEFQRAQHQDRPLSVIMMDLNNFKLFNDTYGHPVGDQVLKRVARALESECRKPGILARYGGDEFIAVLPDTDEPKAMVLAQRLSERMSREGFQGGADTTTVPISLSFGVANYPDDCTNRFELVTIADRNLYQAKITDSGIMGTTETQRTHRALRTEGSFDVLDAMVTAVDNKDRYTRHHSEDVTEYALWIAEELGYSEGTQRVIRIGGLLHDVGKIGVPEDILRKPGKLTDDEYETMKRHTQLGALIVGGVSGMESIIDIVKSHHERWDGKGYPDGLAGEDIPLLGRLLAVADAVSAMTTERPYRKGLPWETAIDEIRKGIGTQFDPEMARAFLAAAAKGRPGSSRHQQRNGNGGFHDDTMNSSPKVEVVTRQHDLQAPDDEDQDFSSPIHASLL
jgi:diguanylate cyclase (GGDEF)-like protein/putative nucleotidyltransferase with HDIG domain